MAVHRFLLALLMLAASPLFSGCQSADSAGIDTALRDYDKGALSLAAIEAQKVYERQDADQWEAAWIMGLCNTRLGRLPAARIDFEHASESPDLKLAARARAMLGQNLLEAGQPAAAAVQFEHAWPELEGEDRRQCAEHAAEAWSRIGRNDHVRRWNALVDAAGSSHSADGSAAAVNMQAIPPAGRFRLQAGAYRDEDGAQRARSSLASTSEHAGHGTPVILPRTDRHGSTLYLVQLGSFETRHAAVAAKRSFRSLDMIVVAVH